ncbi:MAG: hypothetical protein IKF17_06075 [Clostridia bacterium]|nr:hypothetical protein [Clostridia bacterium]
MSIVSFWNQGEEESGKTSAIIALATHMAIEHNYRILVISTSVNDDTIKNAFWKENNTRKNLGLFGPNTNVAMQNGIEGLNRYIRSNKISPDIITNYTKVVFKDRLEILLGYNGNESLAGEIRNIYPSIIEMANKYYDLVLVDVDSKLSEETQKEILHLSNIIVATISQRLASINKFNEARNNNQILNSPKTLILIGRYDRYSKYTPKNISRYLKEKNLVNSMPYNTLFFEACEEAEVPDLFLRLRKISDENDRNVLFINEIRRLSENIIYRLQDLQMRNR